MDIADNTFKDATVDELLEEYRTLYAPMMVDTLLRYKPLSEQQAATQFEYEMDKIKNFFDLRYDYITGILNYTFQ